MSSAIEIRPAQPSDADIAVPLIYSSGPAAFDFVFAHASCGSAIDFLHHAFEDGAGEFGFRNHCVVMQNDTVVGVGAGYSGASALPFVWAGARQIFGHYVLTGGLIRGGTAAAGVMVRGLRVERVIPPPAAKNLFYIGHLAIAPELRSRGIGGQLTDYLLQHGRNAGFKRVALDVAASNPRAQALYEKIGFRVTAEHRSTLRNRHAVVVDHRRMEMPL